MQTNKTPKTVGIVLLMLALLVGGGIAVWLKLQKPTAAADDATLAADSMASAGDSTAPAESSAALEESYAASGSYEVSSVSFDANDAVCWEFEIWYPTELTESDKTYPLVVMVNGTDAPASTYTDVFEHLASWGFIVVGNETSNSYSGESSAVTLDFMLALNEDSTSDFYGKIDTENIGIAGHSQGGIGTVNAVTNYANGSRYQAVYIISAPSKYYVKDILEQYGADWSIDTSKVTVPIMLIAGTTSFEAGTLEENRDPVNDSEWQGICPLWWLNECYDAVSDSVAKVVARQIGIDHADLLCSSNGYMTAWFCYWLQGDEAAGKAFFGENAELLTNEDWQDVRVNNP